MWWIIQSFTFCSFFFYFHSFSSFIDVDGSCWKRSWIIYECVTLCDFSYLLSMFFDTFPFFGNIHSLSIFNLLDLFYSLLLIFINLIFHIIIVIDTQIDRWMDRWIVRRLVVTLLFYVSNITSFLAHFTLDTHN